MAETADSNAAGVDALNPGIGRDMREAGVDPRDTPEGPANGPMNMLAAKQDPVSVGKPDTMSKVRPNNQSGETRNGASDEKSKAKPEAGMDAEPVEAADTTLEANLGAQLNRNLDHNSQEGNAMQVEGKEADSMNIEGETAGEEKQDSAEKKEANGKVGDESDEDPFADLDDVASMDIYDLSNYTFGKKNQESKSRVMQLLSKTQMADALGKNYDERGMRRSVGGVILVHSHNFPHVLLLQRSDGKGEYALPGGRLRPGESDEEGLRRKLSAKLKPAGQATGDEDQELDIGERICNWYSIDFHRRYYPYIPAHVTKVKEEFHVYTVLLPNKFMFSVPKNLQLVAVPLFELFNNSSTYGDVISAIPSLLSRWHINYC